MVHNSTNEIYIFFFPKIIEKGYNYESATVSS